MGGLVIKSAPFLEIDRYFSRITGRGSQRSEGAAT